VSNSPGAVQTQQSMSALGLNYYAVPGNDPSLRWFVAEVRCSWLKILKRCSQHAFLHWDEFAHMTDYFVPPMRILHPLPIAAMPEPEGGARCVSSDEVLDGEIFYTLREAQIVIES
jgi:hypothetical protein